MSVVGAINSYQQINNNYTYISDSKTQQKNQGEVSVGMNDEASTVSISSEAMELYNTEQSTQSESDNELSQKEQQEISQLKITDAKVRAHEHAHKSTAAGLTTSGPNYEYETGPDGQKYAVAGDVNVGYQHSSDPRVNLRNAQKLKAAALAPAEPSSQDRSVARKADMEIAKAQQEIREEENKQTDETSSGSDNEASDTSNTEPQI